MKNKSARHKETNTFKFLPFAERLANVDIDVFHRVGHENESQHDEISCLFHEAITKWDVLNLSEAYSLFRREVDPNSVITLPQLLHRREDVSQTLLKHLRFKNVLSLQALLELVVAFANDLRKDFYVYYPEFLSVIVELLEVKDAEQLEWAFTCLAYLFKFLWRPLSQDIVKVFASLLPLLSDKKPPYVNRFAAESFAFVVRKIKDKTAFLDVILKALSKNEGAISGCGVLLFEVVNGVDGQFHSCASMFLPVMLESLERHEVTFDVLTQVVGLIACNIRAGKTGLFWDVCGSFLTGNRPSVPVIKLVVQLVEYRGGKMLHEPVKLAQTLLAVIKMQDVCESALILLAQLASLLLLQPNVSLPLEFSSQITRQIMETRHQSVLLNFVSNTTQYSPFEPLVLPAFLKHCISRNLDDDCLNVLTQLVVRKTQFCAGGSDLSNWVKYTLDIPPDRLLDDLRNLPDSEDFKDRYVCACVCLPHLNLQPAKLAQICTILSENAKILSGDFHLFCTIECAVHVMQPSDLVGVFNVLLDGVLLNCVDVNCLSDLRALDLLLTALKDDENVMTKEVLEKLHEVLERNFNSPYHELRLLTTHIYSLFERLPHFPPDWNIFSLCHRVESIIPQVATYRDQLQLLENLHHDKRQISACKLTAYKNVPLRYLCGVLYMNFQLLWEPVIKILESHVTDRREFWHVFGAELKGVVQNLSCRDVSPKSFSRLEFLNDLHRHVSAVEFHPHFGNYRNLLWKALGNFAEMAEFKTRDVSELFLRFMEEEYSKSSKEDRAEIDGNEVNSFRNRSKMKDKIKTLVQHLTVFTKIRNPSVMYRTSDLQATYHQLLSHKISHIQKLAVDCLMTYKFKHLTPYCDNLYRLIDDKTFKNELAMFRIDGEGSVTEEHRAYLIPVILKIVYSKMSAKTGLRTDGKSSGQLRRNLVLRFVSGCRESETLEFLKVCFREYVDFEVMPDATSRRFVNVKRLTSGLNLLDLVVERLGGLMGESLLGFVVKVLLVMGGLIKKETGRVPIKMCHTICATFFKRFESYPWSRVEIQAVFETLIWPYVGKLPVEGIHSPTPLLKLVLVWGADPRYFPLLVELTDGDGQCVLSYVMKLVLAKQTRESVTNSVIDMCAGLVSLVPDEGETMILSEEKLPDATRLNYGTQILVPFLSDVLEVVRRKLERKSPSRGELSVLLRLSELECEPSLSAQIARLLIPVAARRVTDEEATLKYITSLCNLLRRVADPHDFVKEISPLFATVKHPACRKVLCAFLQTLPSGDFQIVTDLNACDAKWLDQPDFARRAEAFKRLSNCAQVDPTFSTLIIHNCYYTIQYESDLSLRENAGVCWRNVAADLIKRNPDYLTSIFTIIKRGLRNASNEDLRYECIGLLGHLARTNPQVHPVLTDLHRLTNETDPEVDFFENVTHLQLHRHARALLKLTQTYHTHTPCARTLTQFVLPFATFYLCKERFSSKNYVVDSAIEVVQLASRLLPWHQYEGLLKFYLGELQKSTGYQKQLVRITVAVLDGFHFDLSKSASHSCLVNTKTNRNVLKHRQTNTKHDIQVKSTTAQNHKGEITQTQSLNLSILDAQTVLDVEQNIEAQTDQNLLDNPVQNENLGENLETENVFDCQDDWTENVSDLDENDVAESNLKVLCPSSANRVVLTIEKVLLPQLHKSLASLTQHESSHKVNRKKLGVEKEEDELLRVPISLAVVKLLQRLPKDVLELNLPGVFMKLCTFLKSYLESVRRTTRETLQNIMASLGPDYLSLLLDQMTPLLSRGFQVHVLVYTVHSVLASLKDKYRAKDVDKILLSVLDLCKVDLFGALADEKDVEKIGRKASEAKSTKSYDTLQVLATYVTDTCLTDLILPVKNVLTTSHSFKIVHKAQEALRRIALGLAENQFIPVESLLKFAYGVVSETVPSLLAGVKPSKPSSKEAKDCFAIQPGPVSRNGFRVNNVKTSVNANDHVIVEFGLRLCHFLLKKDKLRDDEELKPFLDPFVSVFKKCLGSRHVKLASLTLQCLTHAMKFDVPSMKLLIGDLTTLIFTILHKYAAAGLSKGDNFELVLAAFKAVSVLVRDVKYHTIDTEQLKTLLLYAEQDLHNSDRQATAFALLRAIISRKLIAQEIYSVMEKVGELSVTSELAHVRLQARLVFYHFLMDYPLKSKAGKYIAFYVLQLNYDVQSGRESAIEMVKSLVTSLPMPVLLDHSGLFMLTLGARLINDDVAECRKMAADCIVALFKRLERPDRDTLFDVILLWFKDRNRSHRQLAAQLCGLLITVEKASFETRIPVLLPVIFTQFGINESTNNKPGRYVLLPKDTDEEDNPKNRVKDHHLFQVLQMLLKLSASCSSFLKPTEDLQKLGEHAQGLLAHPHQWVRLAAAQFIGFVLANLDVEKLVTLIMNDETDVGFFYADPEPRIKSLTLDLCCQLQPGIESELAQQTIKNLIFVGRVLSKTNKRLTNLTWLCRRMRKIVNSEIVETPTSSVLRMEIFKWIAGIATVLETSQILPVLHHLLSPLVREMLTTEESNAPLRQLAKDVAKILKQHAGNDSYTQALSKAQQVLALKRSERKRERSQLAVTDPESFAKKKMKLHEKKKEGKKRKIERMKGKPRKVKRRKLELADSSEIM